MSAARLLITAPGILWGLLALASSLSFLAASLADFRLSGFSSALSGRALDLPGFFLAQGRAAATLSGLAAGAWLAWRAGSSLALLAGVREGGLGGTALRVALGLGAASISLQGLGLVGLWYPGLFAAFALLAALILPGRFVPDLSLPSRPRRGMLLILLAGLTFSFAGSLGPQVSDAVDAMIYHFAAPEHFLLVHKIVAAPWQPQWHMPMFVEMLYAPGFAAGLTEGAKAVNFLLLLACCGLMLWICGVRGRAGDGWIAAALLAGLGQVVYCVWQGKNGLGGTVMMLALAGCLLRAAGGKGSRWWVLAGLCMGWVCAAKPIYGVTAAFLYVMAWWAAGRGRGPVLGLAAAVPGMGVWLLQSALFTGHPVYSLGWGPFGISGSWWLAETPEAKAIRLSVPRLAPSSWPWVAARLGSSSWLPEGSLALAVLAPLALLARWIKNGSGWFGAAIIPAAAVTLAFSGTPRYLLPALALLAVPAAFAVEDLIKREWAKNLLLMGSLAITMGALSVRYASLPHLVLFLGGQIERHEMQHQSLTSFEILKGTIEKHVPPGGGVLLAAEARRLEMPRRIVATSTFVMSPAWKFTRETDSPARMRKRYRQMGVSFVAYNLVSALYQARHKYPGPVWDDRQIALYRSFWESYAELLSGPLFVDHRNGGYYFWKLADVPHAPTRLLPALPGTEGELIRPVIEWTQLEKRVGLPLLIKEYAKLAAKFAEIGVYHSVAAALAEEIPDMEHSAKEHELALMCGFISENSLTELVKVHAASLRLERAREMLIRAEKLYPHEAVYDVRAFYHMMVAQDAGNKGRLAEASYNLDLALATGIDEPVILVGVGDAFMRLGAPHRARELALAVLKREPELEVAADLLRRAQHQIAAEAANPAGRRERGPFSRSFAPPATSPSP